MSALRSDHEVSQRRNWRLIRNRKAPGRIHVGTNALRHPANAVAGPMPEIGLLSEHQVVEYGRVPFPKKNITL